MYSSVLERWLSTGTSEKQVTFMNSKYSAIWSCDTGQWIPCFGCLPRLYVSEHGASLGPFRLPDWSSTITGNQFLTQHLLKLLISLFFGINMGMQSLHTFWWTKSRLFKDLQRPYIRCILKFLWGGGPPKILWTTKFQAVRGMEWYNYYGVTQYEVLLMY